MNDSRPKLFVNSIEITGFVARQVGKEAGLEQPLVLHLDRRPRGTQPSEQLLATVRGDGIEFFVGSVVLTNVLADDQAVAPHLLE